MWHSKAARSQQFYFQKQVDISRDIKTSHNINVQCSVASFPTWKNSDNVCVERAVNVRFSVGMFVSEPNSISKIEILFLNFEGGLLSREEGFDRWRWDLISCHANWSRTLLWEKNKKMYLLNLNDISKTRFKKFLFSLYTKPFKHCCAKYKMKRNNTIQQLIDFLSFFFFPSSILNLAWNWRSFPWKKKEAP